MVFLPFVALATFLLHGKDFLVLFIFKDSENYLGAFDKGSSDREAFAIVDHQHVVDFDARSGLGLRKLGHFDNVAFGDGELLTLRFDSRFHGKSIK